MDEISCRTPVRLADGRRLSPIQIQWEYLDHAKKYVEERDATASNAEVLQRWESVLTALEDDPLSLHRELDWVAKYRVLEGYRERDSLQWNDSKLRLVDLQYHDVRRDKGLYHRLAATGKVERITDDDEVQRAMLEPPEDTRAYFRGRCIERFQEAIVAASWDSLIFDTGSDVLQRVPMREPLRGTRSHVEQLLADAPDAATLVGMLQG